MHKGKPTRVKIALNLISLYSLLYENCEIQENWIQNLLKPYRTNGIYSSPAKIDTIGGEWILLAFKASPYLSP